MKKNLLEHYGILANIFITKNRNILYQNSNLFNALILS